MLAAHVISAAQRKVLPIEVSEKEAVAGFGDYSTAKFPHNVGETCVGVALKQLIGK